jgi:hypothetical protein
MAVETTDWEEPRTLVFFDLEATGLTGTSGLTVADSAIVCGSGSYATKVCFISYFHKV